MSFIELFLIAAGLAMDAFAISVCAGLAMKKITFGKALIPGLYFGVFQTGMAIIGYLIASRFAEYIIAYDHWIVFALLAVIGGKMIYESFKDGGGADTASSLKPGRMVPLALATSIDSLAVGVSFAFLSVNIIPASALIGAVTLVLSAAGVKIGGVFGEKFKSKAEFAGGAVLILIGVKILLEHLGILAL